MVARPPAVTDHLVLEAPIGIAKALGTVYGERVARILEQEPCYPRPRPPWPLVAHVPCSVYGA